MADMRLGEAKPSIARRVKPGTPVTMFMSRALRHGFCKTVLVRLSGCSMPLTQGTVLSYDVASMTFGFTMADERGRIIDCCISSAAMDELDDRSKGKGKAPKDRASQFKVLRPRIEAIASVMFDEDKSGRMTVRIYYHHIWSRKYRTIATNAGAALLGLSRRNCIFRILGSAKNSIAISSDDDIAP